MHEVLNRKKGLRKKYSAELRKFALTLSFYSSKAYAYVRQTFKNLLPELSTIRKWYAALNGRPGFTDEVFHALKCKVEHSEEPILCNLVVDEIAIREEIVYDGKRYCGYVNLGIHGVRTEDSDHPPKANQALVFMIVALNGHWKVPVGYFLIKSLTGSERSSLLLKCFELIHDSGIIVRSLTFDGTSSNINMCTTLGANFQFGKNFKPFFIDPTSQKKIYCFIDPCHDLKLIRNTLGDKLILRNNSEDILWEDIVLLQKLEEEEGLKAATKLTKKHIAFQKNKMKVKLAAQTLSESVSCALEFVQKCRPNYLKSPKQTAQFFKVFNDAFDLLNVRSKFSGLKKCHVALTEDNFDQLKVYADTFENYILQIKDYENKYILLGNRKTGFLGFIICLRNMFDLFKELKSHGLRYLLTYKLNQDHLETFFSAIRSRGGFNDNPSAKQFESSYKRLIVRHEIAASERGNCVPNDIPILFVTSAKINGRNKHYSREEDETFVDLFDHDYLSTWWSLSPFIEDVVAHISGFVVKKLLQNKNMCNVCATFLISNNAETISKLTAIKNRGNLILPSEDVIEISRSAERTIREYSHLIFTKENIKQFITNIVCRTIYDQVFTHMTNHKQNAFHKNQFNNHKYQLIKEISNIYVRIRLFHEGKRATHADKKEYLRHTYTKLIHFKHM